METQIRQIKYLILQDCFESPARCKNKIIDRMIQKNPIDGWYHFTESLLKFQLRDCSDEIKTWQAIKDNFYCKTDNQTIEGYKKALFSYLNKTIRDKNFYYNELDESMAIQPLSDDNESAFLYFLENELPEALTTKQKIFLEEGNPHISRVSRWKMKQKITDRAIKLFKLKYGEVRSEAEMRKMRETNQIKTFLQHNPSAEEIIDFIKGTIDDNSIIEDLIYDKLPIAYRKVLFKGLMAGEFLESRIAREITNIIVENLLKVEVI